MKLVWDKVGEKKFETGVDHGILFPMNNGAYENGVAWSGLTAVNESPSGAEPTKIYADNIVYGVVLSPEEDALTIEGFTYPPEFSPCIGEKELAPGIVIRQQTHQHFGFAYRTLIGNDVSGTDAGYKLHLFYDCLAGASEDSNSTVNDSPEQKTYSWSVSTVPVAVEGNYPTACITIDSTTVSAEALKAIEDFLYGTENSESTLPTPAKIIEILSDNDSGEETEPTEP